MNWKEMIVEAKRLMSVAGNLAFERATVLVALYNDNEFRADCAQRRVNPEDELDALADGINASFLELRELLVHYPSKGQWSAGRLRLMYDKMVKDIRTVRDATKPRDTRPEVDKLREQIRLLQKELVAAKRENINLKRQLKKLRELLEPIPA